MLLWVNLPLRQRLAQSQAKGRVRCIQQGRGQPQFCGQVRQMLDLMVNDRQHLSLESITFNFLELELRTLTCRRIATGQRDR
ncbi:MULTISPECIES: hypothetical protein [unclassified Pseudomonas]|uniref:hypothetical protein n=1 Tax=unclassified Pseudomonas TaxID=196821 RepID=UPI00384FF063